MKNKIKKNLKQIPNLTLQVSHLAPEGGEFEGEGHAPFEINDNFVTLNRFGNDFFQWAHVLADRIQELEGRVEQLEDLLI
jgi:hypothetical protein